MTAEICRSAPPALTERCHRTLGGHRPPLQLRVAQALLWWPNILHLSTFHFEQIDDILF
jgi:hypothetical protein